MSYSIGCDGPLNCGNIDSNEFICIDFETANSKRQSVCQFALIYFKDGAVIQEKEWLIKPPKDYRSFSEFNIQIHGIKPEDVIDKPEFNELWNEIYPLLNGKTLVAHNAPFDVGVLRSLIEYYDIDYPEFNFICTCSVARKTWDKQINYTLKNIANQLGYIFNHHDAHDDSRTCGKILLDAMKYHKANTLKELAEKIHMRIGYVSKDYYLPCSIYQGFKSLGGKNDRVKVYELAPASNCEFDEDNSLYDHHVVFTGVLLSMTRQMAMQKVLNIGGLIDQGVTKNTNYLIMGIQDYAIFADGKESSKTKKAKKYIEEGQDIQIINEDDFIKMII